MHRETGDLSGESLGHVERGGAISENFTANIGDGGGYLALVQCAVTNSDHFEWLLGVLHHADIVPALFLDQRNLDVLLAKH